MTDDEVQVFLTMKFHSMDDVVTAFKTACKLEGHEGEANKVTTMACIAEWCEQGCPQSVHITKETAHMYLNLKFGSLHQAYTWWTRMPRGVYTGLSMHELRLVTDYVPSPRS